MYISTVLQSNETPLLLIKELFAEFLREIHNYVKVVNGCEMRTQDFTCAKEVCDVCFCIRGTHLAITPFIKL